jgi:hypothetical protein
MSHDEEHIHLLREEEEAYQRYLDEQEAEHEELQDKLADQVEMEQLGLEYGPTDYKPRLFSIERLRNIIFPQEPMVVKDWLPRGGSCIIHGKWETQKSFLATTLANCVAKGEPFMGYETNQGRVVYVQMDMSPQVQHNRIIQQSDYLAVKDLYWVLGTIVGSCHTINPRDGIPTWAKEIRALDPDLVIWDTLRDLHTLDENASDTPKKVFDGVKLLVSSKPCNVFISHNRKGRTDSEGYTIESDEELRGSSAWAATVDAMVEMSGKKDRVKKMMTFTKARCMERPDPVAVQLNANTLLMELYRVGSESVRVAREWVEGCQHRLDVQDVVNFLLGGKIVEKTRAYEIANELCEEGKVDRKN